MGRSEQVTEREPGIERGAGLQNTSPVSKKPAASRGLRVEFQNPNGTEILQLRVHLKLGEAAGIAAWVNGSDRHKADGAAVIRAAAEQLRELAKVVPGSGRARDRRGLIQGSIPAHLKRQIRLLAKEGERDASDLVRTRIYRWVDPVTGMRKTTKARKDDGMPAGKTRVLGPANLLSYAEPTRRAYLDAKAKRGGLVRFQVVFSRKAAAFLRRELRAHQLPVGEFLTAVVARVCQELDPEGHHTGPASAEAPAPGRA